LVYRFVAARLRHIEYGPKWVILDLVCPNKSRMGVSMSVIPNEESQLEMERYEM